MFIRKACVPIEQASVAVTIKTDIPQMYASHTVWSPSTVIVVSCDSLQPFKELLRQSGQKVAFWIPSNLLFTVFSCKLQGWYNFKMNRERKGFLWKYTNYDISFHINHCHNTTYSRKLNFTPSVCGKPLAGWREFTFQSGSWLQTLKISASFQDLRGLSRHILDDHRKSVVNL